MAGNTDETQQIDTVATQPVRTMPRRDEIHKVRVVSPIPHRTTLNVADGVRHGFGFALGITLFALLALTVVVLVLIAFGVSVADNIMTN